MCLNYISLKSFVKIVKIFVKKEVVPIANVDFFTGQKYFLFLFRKSIIRLYVSKLLKYTNYVKKN